MDMQKEDDDFDLWWEGNAIAMMCEEDEALKIWQAAKAQAVPEGFVLVPINPSEDAIDKLASVICDEFDTTISGSAHCASEAYKAMLEAQEPK